MAPQVICASLPRCNLELHLTRPLAQLPLNLRQLECLVVGVVVCLALSSAAGAVVKH
jgi:hypothetical protein